MVRKLIDSFSKHGQVVFYSKHFLAGGEDEMNKEMR